MEPSAAIILAAGKSTRMKSEAPKVLHEICGKPMLWYVLQACRDAGVSQLAVVVGHRKDDVIAAFADQDDIVWVEQKEQKGTGHAALVCEDALGAFRGQVLVIAGDMPLIHGATLQSLLRENRSTGDALTLATSILDEPAGYGRIVRDRQGKLAGIIEHNDCAPEQLQIDEVNVSYYCFAGERLFEILHLLRSDNVKGEYYITDAVAIALERGWGVGAVAAVPAEDAMGINSRADLAVVSRVMQTRIQAEWMNRSVTIVDPTTTWIETGADLGPETIVYPFSFVGGKARIGAGCRIGPHACLAPGETVAAGSSVGVYSPGRA